MLSDFRIALCELLRPFLILWILVAFTSEEVFGFHRHFTAVKQQRVIRLTKLHSFGNKPKPARRAHMNRAVANAYFFRRQPIRNIRTTWAHRPAFHLVIRFAHYAPKIRVDDATDVTDNMPIRETLDGINRNSGSVGCEVGSPKRRHESA